MNICHHNSESVAKPMKDSRASDSVDVAFELMLYELEQKSDELNAEGAAFFRNSEYDKAKERADHGKSLRAFRDKIELIRNEWLREHSTTFPKSEPSEIDYLIRTIASATKAPKTVLVVKFLDGETLYEKVAADTFVQTIKKFGLEKVRQLEIEINRGLLVSKVKPERYQYYKEGDYFIVTHSSTAQKKDILEKIAAILNVPITVNIVDG